ncbi:MAG: hypothetical protein IPI00_00685 [Flavobacteriales bacterium]|nr:hypothetical protein [Flavobacteriales bacterium]
MNFQPLHKRTLLHTALFIIAVTCSLFANAQGHVVFKGSILMAQSTNAEVSMIVTDGVDTMDVMIGCHGQYYFAVPTNETVSDPYQRRTHHQRDPTRYPQCTSSKRPIRTPRNVEFYVQLERQDKNYPMECDGLAGKIYFTPTWRGCSHLARAHTTG